MKRSGSLISLLMLSVLVLFAFANGSPEKKAEKAAEKAEKKAAEYVGVKKGCKLCHSRPKLGGAEYLHWEKTKHAKAYEALTTDKAKQMAAQMGVTDPANDEKCLVCHVTTLEFKTAELRQEGIGCERCHGPGSEYKTKSVMEDYEAAIAAGMRRIKGATPEETKKNIEALCRECHGLEHKDKNPAAKEFNFEEYDAKIKHDEETLKAEFPEAFN